MQEMAILQKHPMRRKSSCNIFLMYLSKIVRLFDTHQRKPFDFFEA